jgi:hypothetical protein
MIEQRPVVMLSLGSNKSVKEPSRSMAATGAWQKQWYYFR